MTLKKKENIVYIVLWGLVFLSPLVSLAFSGSGGEQRNEAPIWEVVRIWQSLIPFLLIFLIHNFLIAPYLTDRGDKGKYFILAFILMALFLTYLLIVRDNRLPDPLTMPDWREPVGPPPEGGIRPRKAPIKPLPPEVVKVMMSLLVLGLNLSIKLFFKSLRDEMDMEALKQENLESQLQYLRYQINPHFFMNTLNNIHALVDIDPELSKNSIVRLSKMMRYMLYEGDKPVIPLSKEIGFLEQYISLMSMRYSDSVRISLSIPENKAGAEIPPLLFISFVENAFKHGISYQKESFVDVSVSVSNVRIIMNCSNSANIDSKDDSDGGIGLGNTKRRLDLLYGDDYSLNIKEEKGVFTVHLDLPLTPSVKLSEL